jgi:hypothetical protein
VWPMSIWYEIAMHSRGAREMPFRCLWYPFRSDISRSWSIVMTLFSGLGAGSVMAAPSRLTWLRLATSRSAGFGAASPTYFCERFCTSSLTHLDRALRLGRDLIF